MLHAGLCPACENGSRGFRAVGDRVVILCPECETLWQSPDGDREHVRQPASTLPGTEQSVWAPNTHWATRDEIAAAGWADAIAGEEAASEPSREAFRPIRTLVGAGSWSEAIDRSERFARVEMDSQNPEAALVTEPPAVRAEAIARHLNAGRHVLSPLPLADTAGEATELKALADDRGVQIIPLVAWPHPPRSREMRSLSREAAGGVGPLHRIALAYSDPSQSEADLLRSALEAVFWLAGGSPEMSGGAVTTTPGRGFVVTLQLAVEGQPLIATIDISTRMPLRQWIELAGERGSIVCDDLFQTDAAAPTRFWLHGPADEGARQFDAVSPNQAMLAAIAAHLRFDDTLDSVPWLPAAEAAERILAAVDQDREVA